jgi:type IV pilus assembly protein PilQ
MIDTKIKIVIRYFLMFFCLVGFLQAQPLQAPQQNGDQQPNRIAQSGPTDRAEGMSVADLLTRLKGGQAETRVDSKEAVENSRSRNTAGEDRSPSKVTVSVDNGVEMHVSDAPLSTVLRMLSTQSRRNIVASPQVSGTVTADLYDVTFKQALASILAPNNCTFQEKGSFIFVYTQKEMSERQAEQLQEQPKARLFHLNYVSTEDVSPMIQPLLSEVGKIASTPQAEMGLDTNPQAAGGNQLSGPDALMVYDYPSRLREIAEVIEGLDVRPKQVLVEATILQTRLDENNALGIDFNMIGGVNFEMLDSTSPGIADLNTGNLPQNQMAETNFTFRSDFNDAVPHGGFSFGIVKDQIAVFLRALEQVSETTVLANPKVLTLNKQRGVVIVGRRDGYITTTVTETTATQTVEYLETGTQLVFRPFVCDDGYIRMEIHPEDSTGGLNEANLPTERTTEVTTNIMVRDGHTILIGGLFRESTEISREQMPLLGDIPIAGNLFRNNADSTGREEVIILLTVHVVDEQTYAKEGAKLAEDVEQLRIGARQGLQWYGRNRLATLHYQSALEHKEAGEMDKALWDTRMALHLNSTYHPALQLKNELLDQAVADREVVLIRDFINRQLLGSEHDDETANPD